MTNTTSLFLGEFNNSDIITAVIDSILFINNILESPVFITFLISMGTVLTVHGIINLSAGKKVMDLIKIVAGGVAGNAAYDGLKHIGQSIGGSQPSSGSGSYGNGSSGNNSSGSNANSGK